MKPKPEMLGAHENVAGGMKRKKPRAVPSVAAANRAATEWLHKRGVAGWQKDKWQFGKGKPR